MRKAIAGCVAVLAMLIYGNAAACSTAAWTLTGTPTAVSPDLVPGATRYNGLCAMRVPSNSVAFVTANFPGEFAVRLRFFVYTGVTGANPVVLRAATGATTRVDVVYQPATQNFAFTVNGSTLQTTVDTAPRNRWVAVEISYSSGSPFSASTYHRGTQTTLAAGLTAPAFPLDRISMGVIAGAGGTGTMFFDAFASYRSVSTPVGPLCRGDANGSGSFQIADVNAILQERVSGTLAAGQPDCNEDGVVDVFDGVCTNLRRLGSEICGPLGKGFASVLFLDGFE